MKFIKRKHLLFCSLLLVSILCGTILGSGIALAADVWDTLDDENAWNYTYGTQDESPWYSYNIYARNWLASDKTQVNFGSLYYYSGQGDDYDPYFNELIVSDGAYNDMTTYWDFNWHYIEGISRYCDPNPDFVMDTISSTNNIVVFQQYVAYRGSRYSDWIYGVVPFD